MKTTFFLTIAIIAALLVAYALWLRPWLKLKPWAQGFFAWIEPIELALWKKSETILFARLKILTGFALTYLTAIGTIDLSSMIPVISFLPQNMQGYVQTAFLLLPLIISIIGWADERLRNSTTKPIEMVAVPDIAPPQVAAAIARADEAKADAVAAVEKAKDEGKV